MILIFQIFLGDY